MATNDAVAGIGKILAVFLNEEELIIKPFQPGNIRLRFKIINIVCFLFLKDQQMKLEQ